MEFLEHMRLSESGKASFRRLMEASRYSSPPDAQGGEWPCPNVMASDLDAVLKHAIFLAGQVAGLEARLHSMGAER